jgi:hypothetical protein
MKTEIKYDGVPAEALQGSMRDFRVLSDTDLVSRCDAFFNWQDARRSSGTWPFSRSTETGPAQAARFATIAEISLTASISHRKTI